MYSSSCLICCRPFLPQGIFRLCPDQVTNNSQDLLLTLTLPLGPTVFTQMKPLPRVGCICSSPELSSAHRNGVHDMSQSCVLCPHSTSFMTLHLCYLLSAGVEMLKVLESLVCLSATLATAGALALRKCSLARLTPLLLITCSSRLWVVSHGQVNPNNFKRTMSRALNYDLMFFHQFVFMTYEEYHCFKKPIQMQAQIHLCQHFIIVLK